MSEWSSQGLLFTHWTSRFIILAVARVLNSITVNKTGFGLGALAVLIMVSSGCTRAKPAELPPLPEEPETVQVVLYTPSPDGLLGESFEVPKADFVPQKVLAKLVISKGGSSDERPQNAFLPPGTRIISVTVKDGLATVNFSRDVLNLDASERMQRRAIAAVVKTLRQFPAIKMVKFQVEGRESGSIGGRKIEGWWGKVSLREQPWK